MKQSVGQGIDLIDSARKWSDYDGRFAVGVALPIVVEGIVIINVHGLWQNSIKTDTEAKIEQSKKIIALAEGIEGNKVICGDFNLLPDTEAIKMLGEKYRDLIREYSVKNTRSSFYPKEIRYSDYVFADKNLVIKNFEVSDINISDHLPMVLELI